MHLSQKLIIVIEIPGTCLWSPTVNMSQSRTGALYSFSLTYYKVLSVLTWEVWEQGCSFCAATIRGRRLFHWKALRRQRWQDKVRTSETVVDRRCQYSLLLLLSAVGTTCISQTVLALVSVVTVRRQKSFKHLCAAAFTTRGYYWRAAFISFKSFGLCGYYSRPTTIRGRCLFEEIRIGIGIFWKLQSQVQLLYLHRSNSRNCMVALACTSSLSSSGLARYTL